MAWAADRSGAVAAVRPCRPTAPGRVGTHHSGRRDGGRGVRRM